jgi:outer membrane lipoprotein carrier protein
MKAPAGSSTALLYLVFSVLAFRGALALPSVQETAKAVDEHYNRVVSLQADFTEIYQGSGIERTESGQLWLKKQGKMRWQYRSPEVKLFIGDGRNAWLYLPAERQVRKSSLKKLEDLRSPLAFLLGKLKLEKELADLSFAPGMAAWMAEDVVLRGVPRGQEDRVREVDIEITPDDRIVRILLEGQDESTTEYRFSHQRENVEIPDRWFEFRPEAGTEVIEGEPSS